MARKPKIKTEAEQMEAMNSPVRSDGVGEHPAIKALMTDFPTMSDREAGEIGLLLREIIRGQSRSDEAAAAMRAEIARLDDKVSSIDRDREKFFSDTLERAERLKLTGMDKDKAIAEGSNQFSKALEFARAKQVEDNLRFEASLAASPMVPFVSAGNLITVMENGAQVSRILPEEIRIRNKKWVLPPGQIVYIPEVVKNALERRRNSQAETSERMAVLSADNSVDDVAKRFAEIDNKYKTTSGFGGMV